MSNILSQQGLLGKIGGDKYLIELVECVPGILPLLEQQIGSLKKNYLKRIEDNKNSLNLWIKTKLQRKSNPTLWQKKFFEAIKDFDKSNWNKLSIQWLIKIITTHRLVGRWIHGIILQKGKRSIHLPLTYR